MWPQVNCIGKSMLGPAAAVPVAFWGVWVVVAVSLTHQRPGGRTEEDEEARARPATTKQEKGIPIAWAISGGAMGMRWMNERDPAPSGPAPFTHSIRALVSLVKAQESGVEPSRGESGPSQPERAVWWWWSGGEGALTFRPWALGRDPVNKQHARTGANKFAAPREHKRGTLGGNAVGGWGSRYGMLRTRPTEQTRTPMICFSRGLLDPRGMGGDGRWPRGLALQGSAGLTVPNRPLAHALWWWSASSGRAWPGPSMRCWTRARLTGRWWSLLPLSPLSSNRPICLSPSLSSLSLEGAVEAHSHSPGGHTLTKPPSRSPPTRLPLSPSPNQPEARMAGGGLASGRRTCQVLNFQEGANVPMYSCALPTLPLPPDCGHGHTHHHPPWSTRAQKAAEPMSPKVARYPCPAPLRHPTPVAAHVSTHAMYSTEPR